jgi:hypothetical protein
MKNKIYLFILGISLSSCVSLSNGYIVPPFNYQPTNFKYIKSVLGSHSESYFLGLGGDTKGVGLNNTALNELKKEANLKSNQTLTNIAYDNKKTYSLFWMHNKVFITADVIEFYSSNNQSELLKKVKTNIVNNNHSSNNLGIQLENYNKKNQINELKASIHLNDKVEVKTSFKTYIGIFVIHGSDRFEIKTTKGKRKIFIYKEIISLKKVD